MGLKQFLFGKISRKIISGFLIVALLLGIIAGVGSFYMKKIVEPLNEDIPKSMEHLKEDSNLDALARFIQYYDEVLTMSARNYAFTSDLKWKTRYYDIVPRLDEIIKEAIEKGELEKDLEEKGEEIVGFFESVNDANLALVEMEENAIEHVDHGHPEHAVEILESDEYWRQKEIYKQGLVNYVEKRGKEYNEALIASTDILNKIILDNKKTIELTNRLNLILVLISFIFALGFGLFISRKISKPIEQLSLASEELEKKNFKTRVNIKTGDELERLGETFNQTAQALENMDKEYKQLEKSKTEFLSITSHELRSPMTPMQAQLQMLLGEYYGKLNEKQKQSLEIVARNTKRLDNIIVDFLEISRIEAARLKFRFLKKDLTSSINRVIEEMKGFMPEKKIKIVADIGKLPVIEVDPDRVMQVLRNLMNNAIKFSKESSVVKISVKLNKGMILFSVKDEGIGIKREEQKRIFEPFFQAEQTMYREHQGTGLGLAIARGIVESQNGRVWLEGAVGKGSIFYFTVPLKPVLKIKPIKLLFSNQEEIEKKVRAIFLEILGPMGSQEFESLERKNQINKKDLIWYADFLMKKGILDLEKGQIFKRKLLGLFGDKSVVGAKKISVQGLAEKGLIKTKEKSIAEKLREKGLIKDLSKEKKGGKKIK